MYTYCEKCRRGYDDAGQWTICPHSPLGGPIDDLCPKCDTLYSRHQLEAMMNESFSPVGLSNLYTMGLASAKDPRQNVPAQGYICPPCDVRVLRARVIFEEALETLEALGIKVVAKKPAEPQAPHLPVALTMENVLFIDEGPAAFNLEEAIDGNCDLIYVAVGTLCSMGVPDLPHLLEVCRANGEKFPNGVATTDANGKFTKPPGWQAPSHARVRGGRRPVDMAAAARQVADMARAGAVPGVSPPLAQLTNEQAEPGQYGVSGDSDQQAE